jgi:hypothetical protein
MAELLVTVTPLTEHDIEDVGRVLGTAFASSPLERAIRGPIGDRQRRVPQVDLAAAAFEEARKARQHRAAHEREHGMRLRKRAGDRNVDRARVERAGQARDEIRGKERRVARTGDDVWRRRGRESRVQSRERTGEAGDRIGDDRIAEARVTLGILVRVDDDRADLRRETRDDVRDERAASSSTRPLSTPPMRRPSPPARTTPVMS